MASILDKMKKAAGTYTQAAKDVAGIPSSVSKSVSGIGTAGDALNAIARSSGKIDETLKRDKPYKKEGSTKFYR